jgi:hypothetical protein
MPDFMMSDFFAAMLVQLYSSFLIVQGDKPYTGMPGGRNHTSYISKSDISD